MTSLLRSKFSGSARRVFYVDGQHLSVYEWSRGAVQRVREFRSGDEGLGEFARYLRGTVNVAAYLLVDVVEEEYRRDTLPHVMGQDRQSLIRHRARRVFRDTPYWYAELQGRESGGRRDDIVLYTALSNEGLLAPWLELMQQHQVPLVGIYSLPLLSSGLLRHLSPVSDHALVVSLQGPGRLRQSFFQGVHLKISRLAHVSAAKAPLEAAAILEEVEKLRRYLSSLRLLSRGGALDVYLLGYGEMRAELEREALSTGPVRYHLVDTAELAWRLGMSGDLVSPYAESLFVQLLLRNCPTNHYATPDQTHYFAMRRVRAAMLAASAVLMFGSVLWSGLQWVEGMMYQGQSAFARRQVGHYSLQYEQARAAMPEVPAEPAELKAAVDTARILDETRTMPAPAMGLLGQVLGEYPTLRVDELKWRVGNDSDTQPGSAGIGRRAGRTVGQRGRGAVAVPVVSPEVAVIRGQVFPFDGDFRKALETVEGFVRALLESKGVQDVEVISMPLNVSPTESLKGDVGARHGADRAVFSVKVALSHGAG